MLKNEAMGSSGRKRGACGQVCPMSLRSDPAGKSVGESREPFSLLWFIAVTGEIQCRNKTCGFEHLWRIIPWEDVEDLILALLLYLILRFKFFLRPSDCSY